jgi:hypothetical protein
VLPSSVGLHYSDSSETEISSPTLTVDSGFDVQRLSSDSAHNVEYPADVIVHHTHDLQNVKRMTRDIASEALGVDDPPVQQVIMATPTASRSGA